MIANRSYDLAPYATWPDPKPPAMDMFRRPMFVLLGLVFVGVGVNFINDALTRPNGPVGAPVLEGGAVAMFAMGVWFFLLALLKSAAMASRLVLSPETFSFEYANGRKDVFPWRAHRRSITLIGGRSLDGRWSRPFAYNGTWTTPGAFLPQDVVRALEDAARLHGWVVADQDLGLVNPTMAVHLFQVRLTPPTA